MIVVTGKDERESTAKFLEMNVSRICDYVEGKIG